MTMIFTYPSLTLSKNYYLFVNDNIYTIFFLRHTQLTLLLDYIYTGEIHASKYLMEEFELCLKELGILGTHAYVYSDKNCGLNEAELPNSLKQKRSFLKESATQLTPQIECEGEVACGSTGMAECTQNFTSDSSDSENQASEEEMACESKHGSKFKCSICHEDLPSKNELKAHFKSHSSERPYVCPVCQKSFRHLNVLRTHSRVHTGLLVHFLISITMLPHFFYILHIQMSRRRKAVQL